jgi:hypothetical protein
MTERSRGSVLAGRWPWPAPPGYVNVDVKDGPNIIPDDRCAPHIRKCFELIATGLHTQVAFCEWLQRTAFVIEEVGSLMLRSSSAFLEILFLLAGFARHLCRTFV